ncbi:MAG: AAA family ATPase [Proteobacteria bacterium]|nr:AAA family ATPase [Pseudomonadota bacterium]
MALLNDILKWTETLPEWQRDAARRLLQKEEGLSDDDYTELYILLKAAHGLSNPDELEAEPLADEHLPAEIKPGETVILKAMRELKNVNRIAPDQTLIFAENGITVIYGGNASGKSGYARVMKCACRARDQSEQVLPNANDPAVARATPTAKLDIEIAGVAEEVLWSRDNVPPEELSTIAVFDSRCARSYLTAEQDVAYLPYGLDIVENLANKVLPELTRRLDGEIAGINIDTKPFEHLHGDTAVGKQIEGISKNSVAAKIKTLGTLTEDESKRLIELEKALAEKDPMVKAKELELSASRLKELGKKVVKPLKWVSNNAVKKLQKLDVAKSAAEEAEKKAAETLQAGETLLPGTGEKIWKTLFDSARKYSTEVAYPECEFPHTAEGAVCPLCQEPLGEAGQRFQRFEKYVKNDIAKKAKDERQKVETAKQKIESAVLEIGLNDALAEEIKLLNESLPSIVIAFGESVETRRQWMLDTLESHKWDEFVELSENPRTQIRNLAAHQLRASRIFKRASDEKKKKELVAERDELVARQNLSKSLESVLALLQRMKDKDTLEKCRLSLRTRPISDKSKEFASMAVTKELKKELDREFKSLGVGHIKTKLKERNERGRMLHQLILDLPTNHNLDAILSEGEQRAIAIGAFMAELVLANHPCGIVFDDPVSSLDHKWRHKVAKRLASESTKRQVIIFTHDVVFLSQLQNECQILGVEPTICFLEREGGHSGIVAAGLPWVHKSFGERIDALEKGQRQFIRLPWPADPNEELAGQIVRQYSFLRATIERIVQDLILNGTVQRFNDYIDVNRLKQVVGLKQEEVDEVFRLMKRCHDIIEAHDPSSVKDEPPPTPDELKQDIDDLKQLIQTIKDRRNPPASIT